MARGSFAFLAVAVLALALVTSLSAAPISGSFSVDIVFAPTCVSALNALNVTLPCNKVSDTIMKFEADLIVRLTISGLEIGSTTVFTFEGLEFQAFRLAATIGALTIRDTFIFAPSITEIEDVRTMSTLSLRYCINFSAPGDLTPPFLDCPATDSLLYDLIEDVGVFHPAYQNLVLATLFDAAGMLSDAVVFRKKIVEISLSIAGLTISTRALFANLGTSTTPSFVTGLIVALEGQTVSGITVRAESWIGARQGLECFGECKPLEIYRVGKVLSPQDFTIQEEKLFLRNLVLAGVMLNLRAEFQFFTQTGSSTPNPGITFVQIDSRARLQPLNLNVSNTLRLGPDLNPRYDLLQASFKFGDVSVTASWVSYIAASGVWEGQLAEFISVLDPPGVTLTSDLILCTESLFVGFCTGGTLEHDVYVSTVIGDFVLNSKAVFFGLMNGFSELWMDVAWRTGHVDFALSAVLKTDYIEVVRLSSAVRF
ncbi:hypothetical protein HYR54_10185 [Candidatus Acetothermia bacterium]|nr:hypothetical protein [Candidatus Acetothermia bacterium]MBI3461382.1 hypothetical protein [Candidatus Acetothermia bacterium]MBI3661083.1 hypothetical protein [Candidatus Acetothermia bacterium]